ncbi:MAG TPA: VTT domain-containing protein [Roseiflexaceae bacterium]|nr:VTT domain-containing protein [Roseiflexaceae bacterium]HMP39716.1 VTT domain-containing protein [Roseiflexaceae bacterium]
MTEASRQSQRRWVQPALAGILFVAANVALYLALQTEQGARFVGSLGGYAYLGAFVVMLVANATVVVPVPWPGILLPIAQNTDNLALVVFASAFGSVLGESVAFFVGRSGRGVVADTRFYRWVQQQLTHPWRAFAVLFLLSAPPNPLFDVAGLTAGATGLPYWMFFSAVLLARLVRFAVLLSIGIHLL